MINNLGQNPFFGITSRSEAKMVAYITVSSSESSNPMIIEVGRRSGPTQPSPLEPGQAQQHPINPPAVGNMSVLQEMGFDVTS